MSFVKRDYYDRIAELRNGYIYIPDTEQIIGEYTGYDVRIRTEWGGFESVCRGGNGEILNSYSDVIGTYENGTVYDPNGDPVGTYDGYCDDEGLAAAAVLLLFPDDALNPFPEILDNRDRLVAVIRNGRIFDADEREICDTYGLPGSVSGYKICDDNGVQQGQIQYGDKIYDNSNEYLGCCRFGNYDDVETAGIILTLMREKFGLRELENASVAIVDQFGNITATISGDRVYDPSGYPIGDSYSFSARAENGDVVSENGKKCGSYENDGEIYDRDGNFVAKCLSSDRSTIKLAAIAMLSNQATSDTEYQKVDPTGSVLYYDGKEIGITVKNEIFDKDGILIGSFEDHNFYTKYGVNKGRSVGRTIYSGNGDDVGYYEDRTAYWANGEPAGTFEVTNEQDEIYECSAGALLLYRMKLGIPEKESKQDEYPNQSSDYSIGAAAATAAYAATRTPSESSSTASLKKASKTSIYDIAMDNHHTSIPSEIDYAIAEFLSKCAISKTPIERIVGYRNGTGYIITVDEAECVNLVQSNVNRANNQFIDGRTGEDGDPYEKASKTIFNRDNFNKKTEEEYARIRGYYIRDDMTEYIDEELRKYNVLHNRFCDGIIGKYGIPFDLMTVEDYSDEFKSERMSSKNTNTCQATNTPAITNANDMPLGMIKYWPVPWIIGCLPFIIWGIMGDNGYTVMGLNSGACLFLAAIGFIYGLIAGKKMGKKVDNNYVCPILGLCIFLFMSAVDGSFLFGFTGVLIVILWYQTYGFGLFKENRIDT